MTSAKFFRLSDTVSADFKKAVFAPSSAPRVLNEPVLVAAGHVALTVANDGDSMVDFLLVWVRTRTGVRHNDTVLVEVHTFHVRVVGGANRLLSENALQEVV